MGAGVVLVLTTDSQMTVLRDDTKKYEPVRVYTVADSAVWPTATARGRDRCEGCQDARLVDLELDVRDSPFGLRSAPLPNRDRQGPGHIRCRPKARALLTLASWAARRRRRAATRVFT